MKQDTYNNSRPSLMSRLRQSAVGMAATGIMAVVAACSSDAPEADNNNSDMLQLLPFASTMTEVTRADIDGVTVPDNFVAYSTLYPKPDLQYATIRLNMRDVTSNKNVEGTFTYQGDDTWKSYVPVENAHTYYIYGFMPSQLADNTTITSSSDAAWATTATISINDMPVIAAFDPCVVVGVQDVSSTETGGVITPDKGEVKLGTFQYVGKEQGRNFVRLLLDHLYAGLHFQFRVGEEYRKLRRIHLTQIELTSTKGATIDCTVNLIANNTNTTPISSIAFGDVKGSSSTAAIFSGDELLPLDGQWLDILGGFAPTIQDIGSSFSIKVTYDVYDTNGTSEHPEGNLIRKGCTAENKVPDIPSLNRGQKYTLRVTVEPTYLYVLSDPDLDNPTFTIQ